MISRRVAALCLSLIGAHPAMSQTPPAPRTVVWEAQHNVESGGGRVDLGAARRAVRVRPRDSVAVLRLATLARLTYDFPSADSAYLSLRRATPTASRFAAAAALGLGASLSARGLAEQAGGWLHTAVLEARLAHDTLQLAEALLGLAGVALRVQGPSAALAYIDSVEALPLSADSGLVAAARCRRAHARAVSSDARAAADAGDGAAIARRHDRRRVELNCLLFLGMRYVRSGALDSAQVLLRVLDEARHLGDRALAAAAAQWISFGARSAGNLAPSRAYALIADREGNASGDMVAQTWTAINIGALATALGDLPVAAGAYERADSLARLTHDVEARLTLRDLRATAALDLGDTAAARAGFEELLRDANAARQAQLAVRAYQGLRNTAVARHDYRQARDYHALALRSDSDRQQYLPSYLAFEATLDYRTGGPQRALELIDSALQGMHPSQHLFRYSSRLFRAAVLARLGRLGEAEETALGSIADFAAWRATLDDASMRLLATQARSFATTDRVGRGDLLAALVRGGRTEAAWRIVQSRRALTLLERVARSWAQPPRSVTAVEAPRPSAVAPEAAALWAVGAWTDDSAVLEYALPDEDEPLVAFLLHASGRRAYALPAAGAGLPGDVARLRALAEAGRESPALARRLGDVLLQPLLSDIPGRVRHLTIVADGILSAVPFEILRDGNGRSLSARYDLAFAPSAALVRRGESMAPRGPARVLAFGAPLAQRALGDSTDVLHQALAADALRLPPLRGAAREIDAVRRHFPDADVRVGRLATKESLLSTPLQDVRVLHFATHALVSAGSSRVAIVLGAGANGISGVLTGEELSQLELHRALVVLSACRTNAGREVAGEGVIGFTSALLEGGAGAVVATRWPIDDERVVTLMDDLYRGLARGATIGSALSSATRAARARGASVREWAAFMVVGDATLRVVRAAGASP
jgi:CHAT domain-containing protein/tetratricopeptide (TPR) repeat protein